MTAKHQHPSVLDLPAVIGALEDGADIPAAAKRLRFVERSLRRLLREHRDRVRPLLLRDRQAGRPWRAAAKRLGYAVTEAISILYREEGLPFLAEALRAGIEERTLRNSNMSETNIAAAMVLAGLASETRRVVLRSDDGLRSVSFDDDESGRARAAAEAWLATRQPPATVIHARAEG